MPFCARIQLGGGKKVNLCRVGSSRSRRKWLHAEFAWQPPPHCCPGESQDDTGEFRGYITAAT